VLAVLVNGLPGSGKTTLALALSAALGLPLYRKDAIKETLADVLGVTPPDGRDARAWSRALGAAASETMWTLLSESHAGAVLEAPHLSDDHEFARAGLARARVEGLHEVWCDVPIDIAHARYAARAASRHPIHDDERSSLADDWRAWSAAAEPLGLGPVYRVDTRIPVDASTVATLAVAIRQ
jgi:predicted kinase